MSAVVNNLALRIHLVLVRCSSAMHFGAVRRQGHHVLGLEVLVLHHACAIVLAV